jgi:hypothetical protein
VGRVLLGRGIASVLLVLGPSIWAQQEPAPQGSPGKKPRSSFVLPRADAPVVVDGKLDEPIWEKALRLELPYEVNPGENLPSKVRTEALLIYDGGYFYAGFHAVDPEPDRIRARFTDRDTAFQDDFVGVVVDTFDDERRAFEFFVNPKGVQMDLVVDDVLGNEDSSWDAIWFSAGSLTGDGYLVEMAIPYTSLRFQRGDGNQAWGLDLIRIYPRDRRFLFAMNARDRNVDCYLCQVSRVVGFEGAEPGRNLEVTPTVTVIRTDERDPFPEAPLENGNPDADLGVTAR